jgi:hypothetical protein
MLKFSERTDSWNRMMLFPAKTAAQHAKRKERGFRDGLENFGTPILIVYLPLLLLTLALSGKFDPIYFAAVLFSIASTVIFIFIISAAFTLLAFATAALLGGKAKLGRLYYMVSIAAAPTFVFTLVMNIASLLLKSMAEAISFPIAGLRGLQLAGDIVALFLTLYGFYLMTVSIASLYKFGKAKAVAAWLFPVSILLVMGIFLFVADLFGVLHFLFKTL